MKKQTRFIDAKRRGFLKGAAVASTAAATGTAAASTTLDAELVPAPESTTESKGYRLTDHVRTYYDRARF